MENLLGLNGSADAYQIISARSSTRVALRKRHSKAYCVAFEASGYNEPIDRVFLSKIDARYCDWISRTDGMEAETDASLIEYPRSVEAETVHSSPSRDRQGFPASPRAWKVEVKLADNPGSTLPQLARQPHDQNH